MIQPPELVGGTFIDQYNPMLIETPADIPLSIAGRSLKLARYLVANHQSVRYCFEDVGLGKDYDPEEDLSSLVISIAMPDRSTLTLDANERRGAGITLLANGHSSALWTPNTHDYASYTGCLMGRKLVHMEKGRDLAPSTVERLWQAADEMSTLLFFVHDEMMLRHTS